MSVDGSVKRALIGRHMSSHAGRALLRQAVWRPAKEHVDRSLFPDLPLESCFKAVSDLEEMSDLARRIEGAGTRFFSPQDPVMGDDLSFVYGSAAEFEVLLRAALDRLESRIVEAGGAGLFVVWRVMSR